MRRARRVPGTKYDPDVVYADHSDESDAFDDDADGLPASWISTPFRTSSSRGDDGDEGRAWRARDALDATRRRSGIGRRSVGDIRRRGHRPRGGSESEREDEDDARAAKVDGDARRVEENPVDALVGSSSRGVGERSACTRDAPADAAGEPTATGDAARGDGTSSGCSHPGAARASSPSRGTPSAGEIPSSGFGDSARSSREASRFSRGTANASPRQNADGSRASVVWRRRFSTKTRSNAFERASRSFEDSTIRPNGSAGTSPPPPNACGRPWRIVNGFGRPYAKRRRRIRTENRSPSFPGPEPSLRRAGNPVRARADVAARSTRRRCRRRARCVCRILIVIVMRRRRSRVYDPRREDTGIIHLVRGVIASA